MLEYWEEGYDDIYAKRRTRGEESWLRRQFSLAFYGILQRMSRIDILPNVAISGFWTVVVCSRCVVCANASVNIERIVLLEYG